MHCFAIEFAFEGDYYRVVGNYHPGYPAKITGPPDSWEPGEGGEAEFECVEEFDEETETWVELDVNAGAPATSSFYCTVLEHLEDIYGYADRDYYDEDRDDYRDRDDYGFAP